jgi:hypothetical protein
MSNHEGHKNLRLDNSFTLIIENLAGVETDVSLFLLGVFGNGVPVDTKLAQVEWNGANHTDFQAITTPILTGADVETSAGALSIRFTNDIGNLSSFNIAPNTNLDDCNTLINNAVPYPTGTTGADVKFILGFKQGGTTKEMTYNITHTGTSSKIVKVDFLNIAGGTTTLTNVGTYNDRAVATNGSTSMISVRDSANLTYDEILRSQNGSVLDVRSMGYNLLRANSPTDQMNQCMRFNKIDVNGESVTYYKCPVKDPYQFQNSFGIIDMGKQADIYTLDGETQFNYALKPFTSCQITFNYAELTNLMLVPSEIAEAQYQSEKLKEINEREDYNRNIEIVTEEETEGAFSSADGDDEVKPEIQEPVKSSADVQDEAQAIWKEAKKKRRSKMLILGALGLGVIYFAFGKKLGIRK